jgi:predicted RNA-binding Zn ribbon-like protein
MMTMGYEPELIGGHLLLDLVNTVSWRLDAKRWIDRISTDAELAVWCTAVGLVRGETPLAEVVDLREIAYRVLRPVARGEAPTGAELDALRWLIVEAMSAAESPAAGLVRLLDWKTDDLVATLALAAARLLEREDLSRLRECQDDDCGWLFLDRSKNGSRRWCSSADCGNRARAKRHYRRVHSS